MQSAALLLNWENGLDLIGIMLCLLIITWLLYNRRKYHRIFPSSLRTTDFQHTVLVEWLRQRSDEAFERVAKKIADEQHQLQQWLTTTGTGQNRQPVAAAPAAMAPAPMQESQPAPLPGAASSPGDYSLLMAMADAGLTADRMAERCQLPVDEIELYLKARQNRTPSGDWNPDG